MILTLSNICYIKYWYAYRNKIHFISKKTSHSLHILSVSTVGYSLDIVAISDLSPHIVYHLHGNWTDR
jgi:hypothetical protein